MSEPDDFVPEIRMGLIALPIVCSNFCTDPDTGENPVMDAIRGVVAEVLKHQHQQIAVAAQLICNQAGVVLRDVSEEELNFAMQEVAKVGMKSEDANVFKEIYHDVIPDNEGDGAS
jgi:hypothetical protein